MSVVDATGAKAIVRRIEGATDDGADVVEVEIETRRGTPRTTLAFSRRGAADLARGLADAALWDDPDDPNPIHWREARRIAVRAALDDPPEFVDATAPDRALIDAWASAGTAFEAGLVELAGSIVAAVRIAEGPRALKAGAMAMETVWGLELMARTAAEDGDGT